MTCVACLRSSHPGHALRASSPAKKTQLKEIQDYGTTCPDRRSHPYFNHFPIEWTEHHRPDPCDARDGRSRCSCEPYSCIYYGGACSATHRGYSLGAGNLPPCICYRLVAFPDTSHPHGTCILAGGGHITVHGSAHQLLQECMHGWWIGFYSRGKRPTCFAPTLKPGDSYAPPRHSTSYPWARKRRILRFPPDDRQFGSNPSGRKPACRKVTCCHVWSEILKAAKFTRCRLVDVECASSMSELWKFSANFESRCGVVVNFAPRTRKQRPASTPAEARLRRSARAAC
jgi:hypothetical protein